MCGGGLSVGSRRVRLWLGCVRLSVLEALATYWRPYWGSSLFTRRRMSSNKDDDRGLIAPSFDGQRGPAFTAWSKTFLDAAEGKGNEDFSWADVFRGDDAVGGLGLSK